MKDWILGIFVQYREIIRNVLAPFAERRYGYGQLQNELVFDEERGCYVVMTVGFDHAGVRVDAPLIHIDIIGDKVYLQRDNTSDIIADLLIEGGIPQSDIVLAWHSPEVRKHTGLAVA